MKIKSILFSAGILTVVILMYQAFPKNRKSINIEIPKININPVQHIVEEMGKRNLDNAKRIQADAMKRVRDSSGNHDNEPVKNYPHEWDWIKNDIDICWIHKKSRKKVCNSI